MLRTPPGSSRWLLLICKMKWNWLIAPVTVFSQVFCPSQRQPRAAGEEVSAHQHRVLRVLLVTNGGSAVTPPEDRRVRRRHRTTPQCWWECNRRLMLQSSRTTGALAGLQDRDVGSTVEQKLVLCSSTLAETRAGLPSLRCWFSCLSGPGWTVSKIHHVRPRR